MALRHLFGTSARGRTVARGELGPPRLCSAGLAHLAVMNLHDPRVPPSRVGPRALGHRVWTSRPVDWHGSSRVSAALEN